METQKKPTIQERIDALRQQQAQAQEVFVKCQGAIEILEGMLADQSGASEVSEDAAE